MYAFQMSRNMTLSVGALLALPLAGLLALRAAAAPLGAPDDAQSPQQGKVEVVHPVVDSLIVVEGKRFVFHREMRASHCHLNPGAVLTLYSDGRARLQGSVYTTAGRTFNDQWHFHVDLLDRDGAFLEHVGTFNGPDMKAGTIYDLDVTLKYDASLFDRVKRVVLRGYC
jgi:hypothetical protein